MARFYTVLLSLVFIGILPLLVLAESEVGADIDNSEPSSVMLRETSSINGYQVLTVAGQEIDAAYLEETLGERHGAIILLHDKDGQIDSRNVIASLRQDLPEYGWSTLTIALSYPYEPNILLSASVADNIETIEAKPDNETNTVVEADSVTDLTQQTALPPISNQQRVEAALAFLQAKNSTKIVLVGHGEGGNQAIEILDKITTPVMGLILVATPQLNNEAAFEPMKQPILDIYGDNDHHSVVDAVKTRKTIMKRAGNLDYNERKIVGADHYFYGLQPLLTSTIRGWLKARFIGQDKN